MIERSEYLLRYVKELNSFSLHDALNIVSEEPLFFFGIIGPTGGQRGTSVHAPLIERTSSSYSRRDALIRTTVLRVELEFPFPKDSRMAVSLGGLRTCTVYFAPMRRTSPPSVFSAPRWCGFNTEDTKTSRTRTTWMDRSSVP